MPILYFYHKFVEHVISQTCSSQALSKKKKKKKKKKNSEKTEVSYTLKVTAPMNKSVNNTNSTLATPTLIGSYL